MPVTSDAVREMYAMLDMDYTQVLQHQRPDSGTVRQADSDSGQRTQLLHQDQLARDTQARGHGEHHAQAHTNMYTSTDHHT